MKYPRNPPLAKTSPMEIAGYLVVWAVAVAGVAILAWFNN